MEYGTLLSSGTQESTTILAVDCAVHCRHTHSARMTENMSVAIFISLPSLLSRQKKWPRGYKLEIDSILSYHYNG